jgi:hypothetical protein
MVLPGNGGEGPGSTPLVDNQTVPWAVPGHFGPWIVHPGNTKGTPRESLQPNKPLLRCLAACRQTPYGAAAARLGTRSMGHRQKTQNPCGRQAVAEDIREENRTAVGRGSEGGGRSGCGERWRRLEMPEPRQAGTETGPPVAGLLRRRVQSRV